MCSRKQNSKGFTLITTLILLFLLSGLAIGMLMMVNTEIKVGTQDVQNNLTFHAAEGAIEKMTADLGTTLQSTLSPSPSDITNLAIAPGPPVIPGITFPNPGAAYPNGGYTFTPIAPVNALGNLVPTAGVVPSGNFAGLNALLINVQLQATAQNVLGDEVSMNRTVEVAFIPVFQFGIFCDGDCSFFAGPNFSFAGRVHANGDLYLAEGAGDTLTFHSKISAYGNVIRQVLANGNTIASNTSTGTVLIPTAAAGCDGAQPACLAMTPTEGSVVLGPTSAYNAGPPSWQTISLTDYNGYVIDGDYGNTNNGTGATDLTLPFVAGVTGSNNGPQNYEIIRRPPAGESPASPLGGSRLYNEAAIRVLLSDQPEELPGGAADPDNVRLANMNNPHGSGVNYSTGVPTAQPNLAAAPKGETYVTYFATASALIPNPNTAQVISESGTNYWATTADWPYAPVTSLAEFGQEFDSVDEGAVGFPYLFSNGYSQSKAPNPFNMCTTSNGVCSATTYPYYTPPQLNNNTATDTQWNLVDGYLRVEMLPQNGACPGPGAQVNGYCAVTREWLGLGFARGITPPTTPGFPWTGAATQNPANPYAILILQQPKRVNAGSLNTAGVKPSCAKSGATYTCSGQPPDAVVDFSANTAYQGETPAVAGNPDPTVTAFNWYPINFYDPREGEVRDVTPAANSCTPNGVMNAVELDVGNLKQWLAGNIGTTGALVNYSNQNGYILYFSDRRGMLPNPNGTQVSAANTITGDAGLEDVINSASATGTPDGKLEPDPPNKTFSPEDVNLNNALDNFGAQNLGLGLGYVGAAYTATQGVNYLVNNPAPPDPYLVNGRIPQCSVARNVWVSGARHVLKLVDGSLGHLPLTPAANGGFTVGSENPVYITGDYNSNAGDPTWGGGADAAGMAAAGIVADAVTMLSDGWSDWNSILLNPTDQNNRIASTSYYRVAIAAGKNINFPYPGNGTANDFGTDGGVHNFLRYIENWGGQILNYKGSIGNLYYATYNTGIYKCCNLVYSPPTRNYIFDTDFTVVGGLPPGTPTFRDIDNLSYRQSFTPCTVGANGFCTN